MSLRVNLSSQTFFRNPAAEIEKMRAAGPVIEVHIPIIGKVWTTTTQDLSDRVLRDSDILYPGIIFDFLKVWKRWESKVSRAALCVV